MLIDIKVHSAFKDLFPSLSLKADLKKYADLPFYLGSMHPRFRNYAKAIDHGHCQESYAILDKKLNIVTEEDLFIKSVKSDDSFYLVPAVVGGGGKRSNLLLLAALSFAIPGAISLATGGTFLGGYGAAGGALSQAMFGKAAVTTGSAMGAIGVAQTIGMNVGLALITSYFTQAPDVKSTDQSIRTNDMFGSLQNTVNSGTAIPLVYGMHRVTGQLISGYLDTVDHGRDDIITVQSRFES